MFEQNLLRAYQLERKGPTNIHQQIKNDAAEYKNGLFLPFDIALINYPNLSSLQNNILTLILRLLINEEKYWTHKH